MTITLTPELEEALNREAQNQGRAPEELALQSIQRDYLPPAPPAEPLPGESLYDALQGFIGIFDSREFVSGGARLSENTGEKFTEILVEKQAEERKRYEQWLNEQQAQDKASS